MKTNTALCLTAICIIASVHGCIREPEEKVSYEFNGVYSGSNLNYIAFPVGGIGAGMFCIEGTGAISHMSVRNRPEIFREPLMFAAVTVKGIRNGAKVVEGQVPDWKKSGIPNAGNGSPGKSYGLPRFEKAEFTSRFPFATIMLNDSDMPLEVSLTAWSPFIPTDADNSSLPVGALEYTFRNSGNSEMEALFSFNSENFMSQQNGNSTIKTIPGGFVLSEKGVDGKPETRGDFAVFTTESSVITDHCWFRGGWWDPLTITWKTISAGEIRSSMPVDKDAPGASLFVPLILSPGETKTIHILFAWYVPDTNLRYGTDPEKKELKENQSCSCSQTYYKPWYSGRFEDVYAVSDYWRENYFDLKRKSELFRDSFYASTLPGEVLEAVAANLTILKSPTVLRQTDGKLWNWEGCSDNSGCCAGSCTHVWNYAQAIPHLFPDLERTLRETEFFCSQDEEGHQTFRSALPVRPVASTFYAAADGQLGGIMKVYRDWRISGDTGWLRRIYPSVKESMDYCIRTWDPRSTGTLEEPHHNTYDIEFWGPDGMCTSFYLGALKAISEMGGYLGDNVERYMELYTKGRTALETDLFNGEYFFQKVVWKGLNSPDPVEASLGSWSSDYSEEARDLLQKEGPKYQYGSGCLSDGVLGAWIASVCGLEEIADRSKIKSHLNSVYNYNFVRDLTDHSNPQRPAYALGDEGGLLLCSWPKGGKPSLPFVYSDEVWTGIEYQVASHLMMMGEVEKGLEIVRTCRKRYDGTVRNPFDEYECGHWYARAMSSYALLQGLTGVRYDATDSTLFIDSKIGDFTSFISTKTGFGNVGLKKGKPFVTPAYGEIPVKKYVVR
ncbi:MAG: hypothetical protein HPY62_02190 [Bacteroidales bacterium]|nr:hypothetical protein [Bacteroidales bacterium]